MRFRKFQDRVRGPVWLVLVILLIQLSLPPQSYAQSVLLKLPAPGKMVPLSPVFTPVLLKGVRVYPDNPLRFDFIVDQGDWGKDLESSTALPNTAFGERSIKIQDPDARSWV